MTTDPEDYEDEEDYDYQVYLLQDAIIEDTGRADCGCLVTVDDVCIECSRCIEHCECPIQDGLEIII